MLGEPFTGRSAQSSDRGAVESGESSDAPALSVEDLRTEFRTAAGSVAAVRGISFKVNAGERLGVVGESGSGKSSLALSLLRLVEPPGQITGGSISFNGRDLLTLPEREIEEIRGKGIALVLQDPMSSLDPVKSVSQQIREAVRRHQRGITRRKARAIAIEALQEVEIPQAARRLRDYPHQFSGGMRQRVMLAIALVNRPEILVADEPTTALDVTTQAQVLDVIDRIASERRMAIILITHNLGIVAELCQTVHVMYAGRFVESAPVQQIFASPRHPYTVGLLSSIPRPQPGRRQPLVSIPGLVPSLIGLPQGCPFEPRCTVGRGRDICKNHDPPRLTIPLETGEWNAECHFALTAAGGVGAAAPSNAE